MGPDASTSGSAARRFHEALANNEPAVACALLAPATRKELEQPRIPLPAGAGRCQAAADQLVGEYASLDSPAWATATGWRRALYSHSLGLTMGLLFIASWAAQLVAGRSAYNAEQLMELQAPLNMREYLAAPDFWNRSLQNWQSELLAVGSMIALSIFLRERGSPESKPVGAAHSATGVEG